MTLAEFKQGVADITGQFDDNSLTIYGRFINERYRMLWNRMAWNDAIDSAPAVTGTATPYLDLPSNLERVISIRCVDHFLDPSDETFFVETDPSIFERSGIPQYYQEETNSGVKQIRFWPTPATALPLLIVGKKTFVPLVDGTDEPVLRNIDNCLLAFSIGDGLKRLRQVGKASEQYKEAETLYQELVALEKQQTNVPRRTKNLTAAGNSLVEMTDDVCARINDWLPDSRILVKQFLRRRYQQLYDAALWPESLIVVQAVSFEQQLILPDYLERVLAVRANSDFVSMRVDELASYFVTPLIFDDTHGAPLTYSLLPPVAVSVLPPSRELLAFVSTDPNDTSKIMVRGESAGKIIYESVQLAGTAPVYTTKPYDTPLTIAKDITLGTVTVTAAFSATVLEELPPGEREHKHVRLWLQPRDGTNADCLVLGKKRIVPLIQDEDTPELRNVQNILILGAAADAFTKQGKADAATDANTQAANATKALLDLEINQTARNPVIAPYVEPMVEEWSTYAYARDWFFSA